MVGVEDTNESQKWRQLVKNTSEPLIIRNKLNWEILKYDLNKWTELLGNEYLPFRCGKNIFTKMPQYENTTQTTRMTFNEFLDYQERQASEWLYFDYKYFKDWLFRPLFEHYMGWAEFGFPELNQLDHTIWIGSEGAHTPCHVDTYGCNIVAQIFGRKRWILFPPSEDLQQTRVPYEESSIYSNLNFFSPQLYDFKNVSNCRSVVLNPGDVLIVPHKWWHYVENLDLAISINTWIELPIDDEERVSEAIVKLLMSQLTGSLPFDFQKDFFNPGSDCRHFMYNDLPMATSILNHCVKNCKRRLKLPTVDVKYLLEECSEAEVIKPLTQSEFKALLEFQASRFPYRFCKTDPTGEPFATVIDAIVNEDVVGLIKQKLLK